MLIGDRYDTAELLGQGAFGQTVAAIDRHTGATVVAKLISLRGLPGWKPFEYFEREVGVLRSLDHPNLPRYLEALESEVDGVGPVLALVMERIEGESLLAHVQRGHRWSEAAARSLLTSLLQTLDYLHRLSPPVIHRDIKPANVLIRPDGTPVLIDFGAVHDVRQRAGHGSVTVAGTAGYMAPEQAAGTPVPVSDLYGLGATLVHVLSHCHPADLPRRSLRLEFRNKLGCSEHLINVLERLVEPAPEHRFASAAAALEHLRRPPAPAPPALPPQPGPSAPAARERQLARAAPVLPPLVLPAAPRDLVESVAWQIEERAGQRFRWTAFWSVVAAGFVFVMSGAANLSWLVPGSALVLVGAAVGYDQRRCRRRDRDLWRTGRVAEARVMSAEDDLSYWNGVRNRYARVAYTVIVDGVSHQGELHAYDRPSHHVRAGEAVLVVYNPEDPSDQIAVMGRPASA